MLLLDGETAGCTLQERRPNTFRELFQQNKYALYLTAHAVRLQIPGLATWHGMKNSCLLPDQVHFPLTWRVMPYPALKSSPLVSLHGFCSPLNCTATILLRAELEIKESEGLTNNRPLFPLASTRLAPTFGLLLLEGEASGTFFPVSWLCFFYLLQIYCHWLAYFSCAFMGAHTNHSWLWLHDTETDTIGYAKSFWALSCRG